LLQAVQGIPAGQRRAADGAGLNEVQVLRLTHEAHFVEHAVLAERAVDDAAQPCLGGRDVYGAVLMALIEEGDHLVTLLPLGDFASYGDDLTGAVRGGDDG
jgi:hypothetical protein